MNDKNNARLGFEPERPESERTYSEAQRQMLEQCSDRRDMTEWNEWRQKHPQEPISLEGAPLSQIRLENANLTGAYLNGAHLEGAYLDRVQLNNARLNHTYLNGAKLLRTHLEETQALYVRLEGTEFMKSHLEGADFSKATVDGLTLLWDCTFDHRTKFEGVALGSMRIYPIEKALLEYNIRRMNWDEWYTKGSLLTRILKRSFVQSFWIVSDYGRSTARIIMTFFGLAVIFAIAYRLWPRSVLFNGAEGTFQSWWHALYFSVVTMTTLGFGDIAANPASWLGLTLLMVQVLLGYVLLGALITRFAVLFTAGGPSGQSGYLAR